MALQSMIDVNIDFYDKKYILINAKQNDKNARYLLVSCYNHGEIYPVNAGEHSAYIRYKKADNNSVFNFCEIDRKGKIVVELSEQMLAIDGICSADLVIVNKGGAEVDADTGEIIAIDDTAILSTMLLYIDVAESAVKNSDIESSYEYNGLNTAIEKAEAEYTEVMKTSKSWAVGGTGIRDNENTDNAKYYSNQSSNSASAASTSALNASTSETNASKYMSNALTYSQNAETYENAARECMNEAERYMGNAEEYMVAAQQHSNAAREHMGEAERCMGNAEEYMVAAQQHSNASKENANEAKGSMNAALNSETNAKTSETNALNSANKAQSYAVGGTGTRSGEDTDNACYYYGMVKTVVESLHGGFMPMGTISFSELATAEKSVGYVYNMHDDFVTDNTFREGAGKPYTAGTNVYFTGDGYWDCLGGAASPTATVDEVKDYLGI